MKGLIARLNVVSQAPAANVGSTGGPSSEHPGGKCPSGGGMSGQDWWDRYVAARSPESVIREAQDELRLDRYSQSSKTSPESDEQRVRRMLRETQGWTPQEVSTSSWRMSVSEVRRHRARDGRDQETGKPLVAPVHPCAARVVELHREDPRRTDRYISSVTGVPKSTVNDIRRRAA